MTKLIVDLPCFGTSYQQKAIRIPESCKMQVVDCSAVLRREGTRENGVAKESICFGSCQISMAHGYML